MEIRKDDTFVNCPKCGSPIPYLEGTIKIKCPYCGREMDVEEEKAGKNGAGINGSHRALREKIPQQRPEEYEVRSIYEVQHKKEPEDETAREERNSVKRVFSIVIAALIFITFVFLIISLIAQTGA